MTTKKSYTFKKPRYTTTITSGNRIIYKLDHDPKDDIIDDRHIDEGPVEINDPEPIISNVEDYSHTHYDTTSTMKNQKIIYHCQHNVDDIDDRGVIEIPADNPTVIYQDEDGQYYEIPTSDLIEYDGDDGEITYHSKGKKRKPKMILSHKLQDKVPPVILAKQNAQLAMIQSMYGRVFS